MSETYAEQLARVREMPTDSQVGWYDRKAITAVPARLDALERPVTAKDVSDDLADRVEAVVGTGTGA